MSDRERIELEIVREACLLSAGHDWMVNITASALRHQREAGRRDGLIEARGAMCRLCRTQSDPIKDPDGVWRHWSSSHVMLGLCDATPICDHLVADPPIGGGGRVDD